MNGEENLLQLSAELMEALILTPNIFALCILSRNAWAIMVSFFVLQQCVTHWLNKILMQFCDKMCTKIKPNDGSDLNNEVCMEICIAFV